MPERSASHRATAPLPERTFMGLAMPNGEPQLGVTGPRVMLIECEGGRIRRQIPFTPEEAEACARALLHAVREINAALAMLAESGEPMAYRGPYPIRSHRTLAEMADG